MKEKKIQKRKARVEKYNSGKAYKSQLIIFKLVKVSGHCLLFNEETFI